MRSNKSTTRRLIRSSVMSAAILTVTAQTGFADQSLQRFDSASSTVGNLAAFWSEILGAPVVAGSPAQSTDGTVNNRGASGDAANNWINAAGGAWATGANWSLGAPPAAADDAIFNLANTYTVTGGAGVTANSIKVRTGNVTLNGGTTSLTATGLAGVTGGTADHSLSVSGAANPTLTINGGAVVNYRGAFAGDLAGQSGTLNISGAGTRLLPVVVASGNGIFGINEGTGTINISDGAEVQARLFEIGRQPVANGVVTVDNAKITGVQLAQTIIARGGDGILPTTSNTTLTLKNGAIGDMVTQTTTPGNLFVAGSPGTTGTLNLETGSSWLGNQITAGTDPNTVATFNVSGGSTLTGTTSFTGDSVLGNAVNTYNVSGANSRFRIDNVIVTNGGSGGTFDAGLTTINVSSGGTFSVGRLNGNQDGGNASNIAQAKTVINVSGAGSLFEVKDGTGNAVSYISLGFGANTTSEMNVTDGGAVSVVDTGGTDADAAQFILGSDVNTSNTLNVNTNGSVTVQNSFFSGTVSGAVANVNIVGAGASVDGGGFASFGGGGVGGIDFSAGGGTTNMSITGGGVFRADSMALARDPGTSLDNGAKTNITVSGAGSTFIADGLDDAGTTDIDDGFFLTSVASADEFGFPIPGSNDGIFATINLVAQNGGLIKANESAALGDTQDGSTTLTVDGVGSAFDSGRQLATNGRGLSNSLMTINITNGGVVKTTASAGNPAITAGSMFIGTSIASGTTANTISLTGAGSTLQSSASIFLGGSFDEANVETLGSPTTVTAGAGTSITAAGSLDLASNSTMTTSGNVAVAGVSTIGGTWTIGGGTPFAGTLNVVGTGLVKMTHPTPSTATLLKTDNVFIAPTAKVDVGLNAMRIRPEGVTVDDTDLADVKAFLALGRIAAGTGGITSSALAANQAVGYDLVTAPGTFLGDTTQAGDILVRATFKGDTDLNGAVNFDDLLTLAQNYNVLATGEWFTGDFNFDTNVNFDDLLALAQNYNNVLLSGSEFATSSFAGDWAMALSLVPEPTSLAALGMGLTVLGRRRK